MKEYFLMWQNAFNFQGRSRRREYWIPILVNFIIGLVFTILIYATKSYVFIVLKYLYIILGIIPGLSLAVRRLHDVGKSGRFYLIFNIIILILFIGIYFVGKSGWFYLILIIISLFVHIYFLYLFCQDSQIGSNKWGVDPKKNERKSASFSV